MFDDLYRSIDRERRWIAEDLERSRRERKEEAAVVWTTVALVAACMFTLLFCLGV
jgi:hypothetical protein